MCFYLPTWYLSSAIPVTRLWSYFIVYINNLYYYCIHSTQLHLEMYFIFIICGVVFCYYCLWIGCCTIALVQIFKLNKHKLGVKKKLKKTYNQIKNKIISRCKSCELIEKQSKTKFIQFGEYLKKCSNSFLLVTVLFVFMLFVNLFLFHLVNKRQKWQWKQSDNQKRNRNKNK